MAISILVTVHVLAVLSGLITEALCLLVILYKWNKTENGSGIATSLSSNKLSTQNSQAVKK